MKLVSLPSGLFPFEYGGAGLLAALTEEAQLLPLSAAEAACLDANCVQKRRVEFRAGRHAAKSAIAQYQQRAFAAQPRAAKASHEILRAGRAPVFPAGYAGSIAHCGRREIFAVAVVSQAGRALGVDCEQRREISSPMAARILCSEERDELSRLQEFLAMAPRAAELPLAFFSAKEAIYKAVNQSKLGSTEFSDLSFHEARLRLQPAATQPAYESLGFSSKVRGLNVEGRIYIFSQYWLTSAWLSEPK